MPTIFLIRHAEKPVEGEFQGVDVSGANSLESLIPQGWQRAGALASFFGGKPDVPAPDQIYAAAPGKERVGPHDKIGSKSNRPLETITPLATKLGKEAILTFTKGDEEDLAKEIKKCVGVTLVCWQHEAIPAIAKLIMDSDDGIPDPWSSNRFDVVWSLTQVDADETWIFTQICQLLLAGDQANVIE